MSTTTGHVRYLPQGGAPEVELDYAQSFVDLAQAIEGCERSEDVAILLSTCRNHWMTTNAAFLDLRRALGSGDYPDSISAALFELRRDRVGEAKEHLDKAGEYLSYARQKLRIWEERVSLREQLDASIESMPGLARPRLQRMLAGQGLTVSGLEDPDHIQYLVLSDREEPICAEKCRVLGRLADRLGSLRDVIRQVVSFRGGTQSSLLDEPPTEDPRLPEAMVEALLLDSEGWGLRVDGSRARFGETGATFDLRGPNTPESWPAFLGHITETSGRRLAALQEMIVEEFRANIARAPMPEPYVVDLTTGTYRGRAETYEVEIHGAGRASPSNETKVALLKWPIPGTCYVNTEFCRYTDEFRVEAQKVAIAAVGQAAAEESEFVILPELSLPGEAVVEIESLAADLGIGVIAGREHRAQEDGLIVNEALIHIPGMANRVVQVKQQPAVDEPDKEHFFEDRRLHLIRGTALGTILVVICSDYLEGDLLSRAAGEGHIDTVVVCARNGNPEIFEALAVADAFREFCNVIVVNSSPDGDGQVAGADGTLIAVPRRGAPLLDLEDRPLSVDWPHEAKPTLSFAALDMKAISSRSHGRSDRGYMRPSRHASRR